MKANQTVLEKIDDQEHEIALLRRQQRDVKFLASRLFEEIQLRLNKRAMRNKAAQQHIYAHDRSIEQKLDVQLEDTKEALEFIHARDKHNVVMRKALYSHVFKQLFWKATARTFNVLYLLAKKIGRNIR